MVFDKAACFCAGQCRADPAIAFNNENKPAQALAAARQAVLKAPNCPYAHATLGLILNNPSSAIFAESHIQMSKHLGGEQFIADTQLGNCYIAQGKLDQAEAAFLSALTANANYWYAHVGLARVSELKGDYDRARTVIEQVYEPELVAPELRIIYSKILVHFGERGAAITALSFNPNPMMLYERGKIRESMEAYDLAFADYASANGMSGKHYNDAEAVLRIANHKAFTGRNTLARLPRLEYAPGTSLLPLFVTGFPRSGTTLIETMLSAHPSIDAGDELNFIHDIAMSSRAWLGSERPYPFALHELTLGDKTPVLQALRAWYVAKALPMVTNGATYVTDKTPLNEMHLPLISILFGEAPILYVRRHPLDIIISNFSTYLTHGLNQSFNLISSATHYSRVDDLLAHYKQKVEMRFREIRYETLIAEPEREARAMMDHIGLPYGAAIIRPELNKNHARTPSYNAVKKPINDKSVGRWKHFEKYMGDALRIVAPILEREGY